MRRSSAPSQLNPFIKRPKLDQEQNGSETSFSNTATTTLGASNFEQNVQKTNEVLNQGKSAFKKPQFRTPLINKKQAVKPETKHVENVSQYYNVMWGKLSKKKHKTWDGDGILITKERTASLLDTDGKTISVGRGYKVDELSQFTEGQTLCVGGKLVEIINEISKENFLNGHCFQNSINNEANIDNISKKATAIAKPFLNPQKTETTLLSKLPISPRHDPFAKNALVMPRPCPKHQWQFNKKHQDIVDVVVDPYISNVLRPHQSQGVTFLYECVTGMRSSQGFGAILADDMGLGKTLQCIALIWTLYKQGMYGGQSNVKRILIITPGSLVKNWAAEFRKWLGNERMCVFTVNSENKVKEFIHSPVYPVMVISYEMFIRYIEDVQKVKFNLVVCDEAHRLKNAAIKTNMFISSLDIKKKILLTGTPIQNDLSEFYSLSEFCNPGIFGSQASFRRVYEDPIVRGKQPEATQDEKELGLSRANELNRLTSQFLLRRTSDINNKYLPKKMESVVFCRGSAFQFHLYKKLILSRWFRSCLSSLSSGSSHLVCINALKKLCNHPSLLHQRKTVENKDISLLEDENMTLFDDIQQHFPNKYNIDNIECSGKLKVLSDMLNFIKINLLNERVVIVSNYTQTLDLIQTLCKQRCYQFLRLDGQTLTTQRQQLVDRFNRKRSQDFVFLLSSKAGGVGLNLTGASILILFDIDWNPANDIQAMARVWRDGQEKKVRIYRLLTTGTIEEKIYQRQITKQCLSSTVADKTTTTTKTEFSREDLKDLFNLNTDTNCLTHELLNCSCMKEKSEDNGDNSMNISTSNSLFRSCQLGNPEKQLAKNLSMAELMQWQHYCRPIKDTDLKDDILLSCYENIDFVFQTESN